MQRLFFTLCNIFLLHSIICGQNTITLTVSEADNIFLSQNLHLLAQRYNIDKAEAMLIQAGLFENPTISFEQLVYDSDNKQYFNFNLQHAVEVEQLISISGRRAKQKNIEKYNIELARQEFEDILRELKYTLHTNLIEADYTRKSIAIFEKEIELLDRLINMYNSQYTKGNVSLLEKSRLEALHFALKTEQLGFTNKLNDIQVKLRLLLNIKENVNIMPDIEAFEINTHLLYSYPNRQLIANNPQVKITEIQTLQNEENLLLQKRLRVPDFALKGVYDKASNVASNYIGLGISIDLPFFNRNQGNIKAAHAQIEQGRVSYEYKVNEINAELSSKFTKLRLLYDFYVSIDKSLETNFDELIESVSINFHKRNINMLEFIDFYETYKETCLKLYENEIKLLTGIEEINMLIGNDYMKLWSK